MQTNSKTELMFSRFCGLEGEGVPRVIGRRFQIWTTLRSQVPSADAAASAFSGISDYAQSFEGDGLQAVRKGRKNERVFKPRRDRPLT